MEPAKMRIVTYSCYLIGVLIVNEIKNTQQTLDVFLLELSLSK
jgi:hypothetical protein